MNPQYMGLYTVLNTLQVLNDTTVGARLAGEAQRQPSGCYRVSAVCLPAFARKAGSYNSLFVAIHRQKTIKTGVFIAARGRLGNNATAVLPNKGTFQNEKDRTQSKRTCTVRRTGRWLRQHR
jgi:hypothetical protein